MNRLIVALLILAGCSEVDESPTNTRLSGKIWSACQIENPDVKTKAQIDILMESQLDKTDSFYKFTGTVGEADSTVFGRYYVSLKGLHPDSTIVFLKNLSKEQVLSLNKGVVVYAEGKITSCYYFVRNFYANVDVKSISVVDK